jgi:hypothetical protein
LINAAFITIVFSVSNALAQSQQWWRTNGNTPNSSDFLGTSNPSPLIIKTNNVERLRIDANGKIGIGIANPQYLLDVNGQSKFRFNVFCDSLLRCSQLVVHQDIQTTTINAQNYLVNGQPAVFSQWTSISPTTIGFNGDVYVKSLNAQDYVSIGSFKFRNGATAPERNTIQSDKMVSFVADKSIEFRADTVRFTDKVGIGKRPVVALDINGDAAVSGTLKIGNLPITNDTMMNIVVADNQGNLKTIGGIGTPPIICPYPVSSPFWHVGGNFLSPSSCNVLGSTNSVGFSIISGGANRINLSATGEIGFNTFVPQAPVNFIDPVKYEFNGSVSIVNGGNASLFFGRQYTTPSSVASYYGQWGIQYVPADPANNVPVGGLNFWKPYQSTGVNGNYFLFLADNGNVGIGCGNPQYKLEVDGTIRCKEVRVKIQGCDFVFEKEYSLMDLEKRKKKVLEEKHLPEVDAAVEMEKEGAAFGKNFSALLRNVEEHELYLYQLYEKIQALEKENKALKNEIEKLKQEK